MCGGHGLKLALLSIALVSAVTALFAQEPEERRLSYSEHMLLSEYAPVIETDTTIFYRAVQSIDDIFHDVTKYGLSFVDFSRRGGEFRDRRCLFEGVPVRAEYRTVLDNIVFDRRYIPGAGSTARYVGGSDGFMEYIADFAEPLPSGFVNLNFADKGYLAGVKASYADSFRHGWSVSGYVAGRTGRDLHVGGVFTNAAEVGVRLFKHWHYDSHLTIAAMFSPSERGLRRSSVEEAFTLTGNNLYNPSWGYFNGKIRNANVRRTMIPAVVAVYVARLAPSTELKVSAGAEMGTSRYSSLEWYDAVTPLPDNYRRLPSYYADGGIADETAAAWRRRDDRYIQIDWDELYRRNRMNGDGHSIYAVADRVGREANLHLHASAVTEMQDNVTLGYGLHLSCENLRSWQQMRDLLGGSHIVDIDRYLVDDAAYSNKLRNDLRHPDRIIGEGDRFGYDYAVSERYAGIFATFCYRSFRSRLDFAAEIGSRSIFRRGFYEKELFAGEGSFGRSRKTNFAPYALKAAYGISFTPRHFLEIRATVSGEAPDAADMFLQARYNNRLIDNPRLRNTYGGELNYTFLHKSIDLKVSLFAVHTRNDCEVSHYFDDLASEYSDMVVSGIDRLRYGVEMAANVRIARRWNASAAVTAGRYINCSDQRVMLYADTDNRVLVDNAVAHMGDCMTGNTPQIAAVADISYIHSRWGVRLGLNYAGLRYVEPAAMRRTDRVSRQGSVSEEIFRRFVTQERLPDAVTADAAVWRVFWLHRDYGYDSRIVVSLSAHNLAGSKNIISHGRESVRIHRTRVADGYLYSPFATSYLYTYPRTFRLSVTWRF